MKQLVFVIVCAAMLGGCYVGVRSPIYGGTEPPVVVQGEPVPAPVVIEPGWELYPGEYGAPYGCWKDGNLDGDYRRRVPDGHPERRGPGRSNLAGQDGGLHGEGAR